MLHVGSEYKAKHTYSHELSEFVNDWEQELFKQENS